MSTQTSRAPHKPASANPVQHYKEHGLKFDEDTNLVAVAPQPYSDTLLQDFVNQYQQYAVSGDIPFTTILNSLYRKSKEISQMQKRQNSALSAITDAAYQKEVIGLTNPQELLNKISEQRQSIFIRRKCHIGGLEDEHTQLSLDVTVIEQIINFLNDKIFPLMSKIFTDQEMDSTETLRAAQLDLFLGLVTNSNSLIIRQKQKAPPQNITLARTSQQHCGIMKLKMKIEKLKKQLENTTQGSELSQAIDKQISSLQDVVKARESTIRADISRQSANILRKNAMRVQKMETKQAGKSSIKNQNLLASTFTNNDRMKNDLPHFKTDEPALVKKTNLNDTVELDDMEEEQIEEEDFTT